jgi:hypothetical protein
MVVFTEVATSLVVVSKVGTVTMEWYWVALAWNWRKVSVPTAGGAVDFGFVPHPARMTAHPQIKSFAVRIFVRAA